jgi:hypothetical protein
MWQVDDCAGTAFGNKSGKLQFGRRDLRHAKTEAIKLKLNQTKREQVRAIAASQTRETPLSQEWRRGPALLTGLPVR